MDETLHVHIGVDVLSVDEATRFVSDESAGGISIFAGTTRRFTDGSETVELEYEAYEEMAEAELKRLGAEALGVAGIKKVYLAHRLGQVGHGEISVLIAVSAAHRDESFRVCRSLIDRVKTEVPIWKKERYADGRQEWVKGAVPPLRSG